MSLAIGTRLGPYTITAPLGAGGMGEVYRAHDARLNRDVALKVLPDAVSSDPERIARFEREARALATVNHPNIAQIFDVVSAPGAIGSSTAHALVMELVPGQTLDERLRTGGAIAVPDALDIARQIAAALEAAHERGIIHRDLKPANIKLRDDGTVKVLDFGLAKALSSDLMPESDSALAESPTRAHRSTALGVVLGTAAYMAPEQAKGRAVDRRADIWSFGVVCFEMLSGRRLFHGENASDILANLLKADIDWSQVPAGTPPAIVRLLQRCLERDPQRRLRDIGDARLDIEEALAARSSRTTASAMTPMATSAALVRERRWWMVGLTAVVAVSAATVAWLRPSAPAAPPEIRVVIPTPTTSADEITELALSPNGRRVVYPATTGGKTQLWVRSFDAEASRVLPGSEALAGGLVSWSTDGRTLIAGFPDGLFQYDPVTGTAQATRKVHIGFGWTTNADGVVLTAVGNAAPLTRVTADGAAAPATRLEAAQASHRFPYFLPDGRHFLFLATGPVGTQGIFLGSLDSTTSRRLVAADTMAVFAPPNLIIFGREDAVFAQRIDMTTLEPVGAPFAVASNLLQVRNIFGLAALAASRSGAIAFRHRALPSHQIVWLDRSGQTISTVGDPETNEWIGVPTLSPDGRTIAVSRRVNGQTNIWTIENSPHGLYQRVTSNPATDVVGAWSPDGAQLVFFSSRRGGGTYDLFLRSMAAGDDAPLLVSQNNTALGDWSRDGRFVLYVLQGHAQVQRDIWALPMQGDRKPFPVSTDPADEINPKFSPDGHWIAYEASETGTPPEVYVRPFPGPGRAWRLSTSGGSSPQWSRDGKEIDYLGADGSVMAVSVNLSASGVDSGSPVALFHLRSGSTFMPARDGQRFLVESVLEDPPTPTITVILNLAARKP